VQKLPLARPRVELIEKRNEKVLISTADTIHREDVRGHPEVLEGERRPIELHQALLPNHLPGHHSYIKQNPQDFPFQQKRVNEAAFRLMSLDAWIHVPRL